MPLPSSELSRLLSALKDELNVTSSSDDAELLRKIEVAVRLVEHEVGALSPETTTERLSVSKFLDNRPVIAITAATYLGGDYLTGARVTRQGLVYGLYSGTLVTYTHGHASVQPEVRQVLLDMVRRAWRGTQQGYRPGYGDPPEGEGGLPPAMLLTKTDLANLRGTQLAPLGFA